MAIKIPIQYPILGVGALATIAALMTSPIVGRVNKAGAVSLENTLGVLDSPTAEASAIRARMAAAGKKVLQDEAPGGLVMSVSIPANGGDPVPADFKIGDRVTIENQNGIAYADSLVISRSGKLGRTDSDGVIGSPILGAGGQPINYLPQLNMNDPEVQRLVKIYDPLKETADSRLGRSFVTPRETAGTVLPNFQPTSTAPQTYETRSPQGGLIIPGVAPPSAPPTAPTTGQPTDVGTPQPSMAPIPATPEGVATPAPMSAPAPATPQALPTPTAPTNIPTVVPPDILPAPAQTPTPYKPLGQ